MDLTKNLGGFKVKMALPALGGRNQLLKQASAVFESGFSTAKREIGADLKVLRARTSQQALKIDFLSGAPIKAACLRQSEDWLYATNP